MKPSANVSELRRFLGMINQLSKFSPCLAEKTKPLRDLLSSMNQWVWGHSQDKAFKEIKEALSSSEVLALYDPTRETILSADASSYGLGAVLRQRQPNGDLRPIAYISRALTETEQRYAQIEKEALATTWACERFQHYLLGMHFTVETDHKPLVPLLSSKNLDEMPLRVQRFRLRLMRYSYSITHVVGKVLSTADTLSRAPVYEFADGDSDLQKQVSAYVNLIVNSIPATEQRLREIQEEQEKDETFRQLKQYCQKGWPPIKRYYSTMSELSIGRGLLLRRNRIVIPPTLRPEIQKKLHSGHQGMTKCNERAKQSVWWPGIRKDLNDLVENCTICCKHRPQHVEPLMPTPLPDRPWQRVATDLFEWKKSSYLLVVDYYSRFIEIAKLTTTSSNDIIRHLKSIFARHGIPESVMSDNSPQYSASAFSDFAKEYGFTHTTSSQRYPQSNGAAEQAVKTVKGLLNKNDDPYLALLAYRSTPLENGYSPAQLLMGRNLRNSVPVLPNQLNPKQPNSAQLKEREKERRGKQKQNFDRRHRATDLKPLQSGDTVWIQGSNSGGRVIETSNPRSYVVRTPDGTSVRRNRRHLIPIHDQENSANENTTPHNRQSIHGRFSRHTNQERSSFKAAYPF